MLKNTNYEIAVMVCSVSFLCQFDDVSPFLGQVKSMVIVALIMYLGDFVGMCFIIDLFDV